MSRYTENPFGSSHSLDANPFDDPTPDPAHAARIEELAQRERDLERRETELAQKADHIKKHGRNNFPPFYPLIYHSISDEIPEASRPLVTRLFQLWLVLGATLLFNMVAGIVTFAVGAKDSGSGLGSSIGYFIFITPLSFLLWYRPIYNGYMKEQAMYYYIYFFFCGWHLLFSIYMILGIPSTGSAGIIQTIRIFSSGHWVAGIFCIIATVGWTIQGAGNGWYYHQIWQHHNAAGHTVDKAKAEFATHGAKSYFSRE